MGCLLAGLSAVGPVAVGYFWSPRLPPPAKARGGLNVLKTLVAYRLIDPAASGDCIGNGMSKVPSPTCWARIALAQKDTLYRCLDKLLEHKTELFGFLRQRWQMLFQADFDVLLYDLTSTYFEGDPRRPPSEVRLQARRSDCLQVVIALIVTPQGLPLAYEVLPGNTSDRATLRTFLDKIEALYGKARRTWVMDRGIPSEELLAQMRADGVDYLVGTPRGRLSQLEKDFLSQPWADVRDAVHVKLVEHDGELYILARSDGRRDKEEGDAVPTTERSWSNACMSCANRKADPRPTADQTRAARKDKLGQPGAPADRHSAGRIIRCDGCAHGGAGAKIWTPTRGPLLRRQPAQ